MNRIKRAEFLKLGTLAALAPLYIDFFSDTTTNTGKNDRDEIDLLNRLNTANDAQVALLLESVREGNLRFSRKIGYDIAVLSASWCSPGSKYFHDASLISKLNLLIRFLSDSQSADGTVNTGNLESPPDTAFIIEIIAPAAHILSKDGSGELAGTTNNLKNVIVKAAEALTTGGAHTPNHRWVICAALSQVNALYPNKKYVARVENWLAERIFMDSEGHYPERSSNYSAVENNSLITIARLLNKPSLLQYVRKNLEMTYYYMETNGDLVVADSRRQDQYTGKSIVSFYHYYRYMAIKDNNKFFAAIARMIGSMDGFKEEVLDRSLFIFLENTLLQKELPTPAPLPINYEKLFTTSHLLRIRRSNTTATLFGGIDWPIIIASGRSNSPNFFSYRKGNAIMKYLRLSSGFFSMGYFYSEGLKKDGNKYILHKKLEVPYYQPLPKDKRNSTGDYKLSPSIDDRFWNKMDFRNRPVSNVKTLETVITFIETNGSVELNFHVRGLKDVPVTIELCFLEGGTLSGVSASKDDNNFLEKGFGEYQHGNDTIRFGPGLVAHRSINGLEGERYSTHFGSLRTEGMHVYLTGITPFNHTMVFN
ncbi:MAG: hypothetical protein ACHQFX_12645 [Chitinophagales bacterium]